MNIEEIRALVQKVWDDGNDRDIWRLFYEAGKLGVDFEELTEPGPWTDATAIFEKALSNKRKSFTLEQLGELIQRLQSNDIVE